MEIRPGTRVDRYVKYNESINGKHRSTRHRQRVFERRYLDREFVSWDGEGGNEDDGSHTYFLLASSDGQFLSDRAGIGTRDVFRMFLNARQAVTHVVYGGGYDVNMILRDLDRPTLERLYETGRCRWNEFYLDWRMGKSFTVKSKGRSFTLWDILPFFQRPFVAACDEYLGADTAWQSVRDLVVAEKARRGTFDWSELEDIREYNNAELALLVSLANELRERLYRVGITVTRWDGPGAIAAALYKKYQIKSYKGDVPDVVASAGRCAYAGGRFEIIRKGHSVAGAYQYDIRSAYPAAIRHLPCLAHGRWHHREIGHGLIRDTVRFGVYRIEVVNPATDSITQPQPLWMRNRDGTVYFAEYAHGWYWTPEAELAIELGGVTVHEAWEWIPECDHEPFHFVEPLYNKRAALKKAGDGAHVGLKLGLNSLYGKLAQQIGWEEGPPLRLPPYHCLEWAGWVTSHCRAAVYRAAMDSIDDVIAFETDAVFSRVPLAVTLGSRLGEWEETKYESLTYLKSGMYFGTLADGTEVEKTRGINKGTLTREDTVYALRQDMAGKTVTLNAEQTRFITLGQALHQDFAKWRRWFTDPRVITVSLSGKRIDLQSHEDKRKDIGDGWQETQEGWHDTLLSYEYPVAWIQAQEGVRMASPDGLTIEEHRLMMAGEVIE